MANETLHTYVIFFYESAYELLLTFRYLVLNRFGRDESPSQLGSGNPGSSASILDDDGWVRGGLGGSRHRLWNGH